MIRAILDTNVLVSAIIFHGLPLTLLKHVGTEFELVLSEPILEELAEVLQEPKIEAKTKLTAAERQAQVARLRKMATVVTGLVAVPAFERDLKDTHLLALATTSSADYLVTGDHPLQELGTYGKTRIVSPRQFLSILEAREESQA